MKRYLFTVFLFLLLLIAAYNHASIHDVEFISREYILDSRYLPQLIDFSLKHDIRIETLQNWILAESSGREKAYNRKSHDYGLCQLHGIDYLVKKYWTGGKFNVWNGEHNLFIALAYLSDMINEFGTYNGFIAYNIGRSRVIRGEVLECGVAYVSRILPGENLEPATNSIQIKITCDNLSRVQFWDQILFDDRRKLI